MAPSLSSSTPALTLPDHPHGTNDRYLNGPCRCTHCREAHRADGALRRRLIAYGTWQGRVDATQAQLHIKQLIADGMTLAAIARAASLPKQTIQDIRDGQHTTSPTRRDAILTVTYTPPLRDNHTPATGTRRRVQGLQLLGWSYRHIDAAAGTTSLRTTMNKNAPTVRQETADAVAQATRALLKRVPPTDKYAQQVQARATAKGWVPLLAWDDIDNPDEMPKTAPPPRTYHRRLPAPDAELINRIHRLKRESLTDQQIAYRLNDGRSAASVQKIRRRHPAQETHHEI